HRIRLGEDLLVGVEICGTTADELLYLSRRVGPARRRKVRVALNDEISPESAAGPEQPVIAVSLRVRPAELEELAERRLKCGSHLWPLQDLVDKDLAADCGEWIRHNLVREVIALLLGHGHRPDGLGLHRTVESVALAIRPSGLDAVE